MQVPVHAPAAGSAGTVLGFLPSHNIIMQHNAAVRHAWPSREELLSVWSVLGVFRGSMLSADNTY